MSLKSLITQAKETVKDLSSLHVQTYYGMAEIEKTDNAGERFDNMKQWLENADNKTKVQLAYETLIQFDGDSYMFVSKDAEIPDKIATAHNSAVEAGIKTRKALIELFD